MKKFENEASQYVYQIDIEVSCDRDIENNLYGKIFWYFSEIFCKQEDKYADLGGKMEQIDREMQIAIKYCEFCEIIK